MAEINEAAVWSRVGGAPRPPEMPGGPPPAPERPQGAPLPHPGSPIAPELLEELGELRETAAAVSALAERLPGDAKRQLRSVYQALQRQLRELSGLYRLLTGRRPSLSAPPLRGRQGSPAQVLSWVLRRMERSAGRLEALGQRATGETRATLLGASNQLRMLFHELLDLLGRKL